MGFLRGAEHGRSGLITNRNPGLYALLQISIGYKGWWIDYTLCFRERMLSDDTQFTTKLCISQNIVINSCFCRACCWFQVHHSIAAELEGHPWKETQCSVYVGASNILLIPGDIEWMFQPIYTFGSLGKLQLWLQSPPITQQQDLAAVSGLFPLGCCEHSYQYLELWSQQPNGKPVLEGLVSCCKESRFPLESCNCFENM
jgi:hypothetical protein